MAAFVQVPRGLSVSLRRTSTTSLFVEPIKRLGPQRLPWQDGDRLQIYVDLAADMNARRQQTLRELRSEAE
jgi:hypothetical protein